MTEEKKEKLESEYFRSYCDFRKFKHYEDIVSLSLQHPGGGVTGEFLIEWIPLGGGHGVSPQITCFNDALHVLICFNDVIEAIRDRFEDSQYTADELIKLLEEIGFINVDSFKGDYIPDDMFENYQKGRLRKKNLENILEDEQ